MKPGLHKAVHVTRDFYYHRFCSLDKFEAPFLNGRTALVRRHLGLYYGQELHFLVVLACDFASLNCLSGMPFQRRFGHRSVVSYQLLASLAVVFPTICCQVHLNVQCNRSRNG
jgi:hypothetical protein